MLFKCYYVVVTLKNFIFLLNSNKSSTVLYSLTHLLLVKFLLFLESLFFILELLHQLSQFHFFHVCVEDSDLQSHFIEVSQGDIFMKQKMWYGLVLGQLAILTKKIWVDYEHLLKAFFSCFHGQIQFGIAQNFVFCKKRNKLLGELEISRNVNF